MGGVAAGPTPCLVMLAAKRHKLLLCPRQEDYCKDHYLIDGAYYDALWFKLPLRTGLIKMIKNYCSVL